MLVKYFRWFCLAALPNWFKNCEAFHHQLFWMEFRIKVNFEIFFFFRSTLQSIHVKAKADKDHEVYRWHSNQTPHKKRMRLNDFLHFVFIFICFFLYQRKFNIFRAPSLGWPFSIFPQIVAEINVCASECHNMLIIAFVSSTGIHILSKWRKRNP